MKTLAILLGIAIAMVWVGPTLLGGPSDQQAAQDMAADMADIDHQISALDGRIERSARDMCELIMGKGSAHTWGPNAELVCTTPAINQPKPEAL